MQCNRGRRLMLFFSFFVLFLCVHYHSSRADFSGSSTHTHTQAWYHTQCISFWTASLPRYYERLYDPHPCCCCCCFFIISKSIPHEMYTLNRVCMYAYARWLIAYVRGLTRIVNHAKFHSTKCHHHSWCCCLCLHSSFSWSFFLHSTSTLIFFHLFILFS